MAYDLNKSVTFQPYLTVNTYTVQFISIRMFRFQKRAIGAIASKAVPKLIAALKQCAPKAALVIKDAIANMDNAEKRGFGSWLKNAAEDVGDAFEDAAEDVGDAFEDLGGEIKDVAETVGDKIKEAYKEAKSSVFLAKLKITFGRYWTAIEPRLGDILKPCAISLVKQFGKVNASVLN